MFFLSPCDCFEILGSVCACMCVWQAVNGPSRSCRFLLFVSADE